MKSHWRSKTQKGLERCSRNFTRTQMPIRLLYAAELSITVKKKEKIPANIQFLTTNTAVQKALEGKL